MSEENGNAAERMKALNARAAQERGRLRATAELVRDRTRPAHLAEQARNRALDWGLDTMEKAKHAARAHPAKAIGIAAAVGALLARRPLGRLIADGFAAARDRCARKGGQAPETAKESEE